MILSYFNVEYCKFYMFRPQLYIKMTTFLDSCCIYVVFASYWLHNYMQTFEISQKSKAKCKFDIIWKLYKPQANLQSDNKVLCW